MLGPVWVIKRRADLIVGTAEVPPKADRIRYSAEVARYVTNGPEQAQQGPPATKLFDQFVGSGKQ
jgi:hypothetical protein